jgi:uncharacterized membrane protein YfhO
VHAFRPGRSEAKIVRHEPERVEIDVTADRDGFLVLTDLHYPGWEATVDGEAATIHRANHLFRAVWVDAGRHRVRFEYRPASLRMGAATSAGALVAFGVASVLWIHGRQVGSRSRAVRRD